MTAIVVLRSVGKVISAAVVENSETQNLSLFFLDPLRRSRLARSLPLA
jgi:hypothetical protein